MDAAAEAGADLADVVRLGRKANRRTRTIGSAFHGCTFPGADAPLFTLEDKEENYDGGATVAHQEATADSRAYAANCVAALESAGEALHEAEIGDKTMVDSLLPFTETFGGLVARGAQPGPAWTEAARAATSAAEATASLRPLKGRARPLAEKSLDTADPGATSLAMIFTVMGPHFTAVCASVWRPCPDPGRWLRSRPTPP